MLIRFIAFIAFSAAPLLAGSAAALAADLPSAKQPAPAPAVAPFTWSGFHVGLHAGGSWMTDSLTLASTTGALVDPVGTKYGVDRSGVLGGVSLGYDRQFGAVVVGAAADFSWTSQSERTVSPTTGITGFNAISTGRTNWYATVTGRAGYAFNRVLVYARGGVAFADLDYDGSLQTGAGATVVTYSPLSTNRVGWTVGVGAEYAFTTNVSVFAEYDYLDFGSKTYTTSAGAGVNLGLSIKPSASIAKVGVNWRF
jgi:outer membrane immunogenic protein